MVTRLSGRYATYELPECLQVMLPSDRYHGSTTVEEIEVYPGIQTIVETLRPGVVWNPTAVSEAARDTGFVSRARDTGRRIDSSALSGRIAMVEWPRGRYSRTAPNETACTAASGRQELTVEYDQKTDLLYFRLDPRSQEVINRRVSEDVVLDIGREEKIVGIEIMNASRNLDLQQLLPVGFEKVG